MGKFDQRSDEAKAYRRLYGTSQWIKGRAWHLRHNPLCVFCLEEGIATPAEIVDHIREHKGDKGLFYDTKNWQSLCKRHHDSTKQKMERNTNPQIDITGWPVEF